jgi:hypothetical protein
MTTTLILRLLYIEDWKARNLEQIEKQRPSLSRWAYSRALKAIKSERDWGIAGNKSYFTSEQESLFLEFVLKQQAKGIFYTYREVEDLV